MDIQSFITNLQAKIKKTQEERRTLVTPGFTCSLKITEDKIFLVTKESNFAEEEIAQEYTIKDLLK